MDSDTFRALLKVDRGAWACLTPDQLKHGSDPDSDFDPDQLAAGVEVEKEHTDDIAFSKAIAKAHLAELPDYYTRLAAMEAEGEADLASSTSYI